MGVGGGHQLVALVEHKRNVVAAVDDGLLLPSGSGRGRRDVAPLVWAPPLLRPVEVAVAMSSFRNQRRKDSTSGLQRSDVETRHVKQTIGK